MIANSTTTKSTNLPREFSKLFYVEIQLIKFGADAIFQCIFHIFLCLLSYCVRVHSSIMIRYECSWKTTYFLSLIVMCRCRPIRSVRKINNSLEQFIENFLISNQKKNSRSQDSLIIIDTLCCIEVLLIVLKKT